MQEKCTGSDQTLTQPIRDILNAKAGSVLILAKRAIPDKNEEKTSTSGQGSSGDARKGFTKSRRPCFSWRDHGKCSKHSAGESLCLVYSQYTFYA